MNGVHDMGGMAGFGPVTPEKDEPVFHAPWERRAFAITLAMAPGNWNLDMSRAAREKIPPAEYLAKTYYEIWIAGLERLMAERGLVTADEVAAGKVLHQAKPMPNLLTEDRVAAALSKGSPTVRPATAPQRFQVGDAVRARNIHPAGHTRLPRYVRGHAGTITHVHGVHVFPDANSEGRDEAQWLYTVRFAARELWGEQADATSSVSVDAWESYLEPK